MKFLILSLSILLCGSAKAETITLNPLNTYVFRGVVDPESTTKAAIELQELNIERGSKDYPIYLVLDCPGGSIVDGENFIQYVKTIPNVHTISIFAASMCSSIAEGLPGKRYVTENGILMFHRAKGQFEGQFETGELESELSFFKGVVRRMEQRSADRMGIPLKTYKAHVMNEWWLEGSNAVAAKVADEQIDLKCTDDLISKKVTSSVETLFSMDSISMSGCPLLRNPLP